METLNLEVLKTKALARSLRMKSKPGSRFEPEIAVLIERLADHFIAAMEDMREDLDSDSTTLITQDSTLIQSIIDPDGDTPGIIELTPEAGLTINSILNGTSTNDGSTATYEFFKDAEGSPNLESTIEGVDIIDEGDWVKITSEDGQNIAWYTIAFGAEM